MKFNEPCLTGNEEKYVLAAMKSGRLAGDNEFTHRCHQWFEQKLPCKKVLLTPSCTHALEMAAILLNIQPGDEVIVPSYTFVSTANAFVLRGAKIVFVDVRPDTMNIDENQIEAAITPQTKAIVVVHYAGVSCEMNTIMAIAEKYKIFVVEDAAQAMMSTYYGRALGTIGHLGAFSFHETKNFTSGGEGGLLLINDPQFTDRAEIIREKGTNRRQFINGMVDKYTWVDIGSSYLLNEISAAFLYGQLELAEKIIQDRLKTWDLYHQGLQKLCDDQFISLAAVPDGCTHNAHMFYFKVKDRSERARLLDHLKASGISATFHYIPLHSSVAGKMFSRYSGADLHTTTESERLLRLPLYYQLKQNDVEFIIESVTRFFCSQPIKNQVSRPA